MEKPWMPVVAGLLDIVSGAFGIIVGTFLSLRMFAARAIQQGAAGFGPRAGNFSAMPHFFFPGMSAGLGIALIIIGVLAIIGGVYALRQKVWGMALAGSIASVITGCLMGVLALIFTVLGRPDFNRS
jgi:hypothetical protein